jgi:two-component system, NtrC family, sensor kinase
MSTRSRRSIGAAPTPRSGPRRPRPRFTTRRRLIATFAVVLAAFGVSLGIPLAGLHRMEEPFDLLEQHEESERVALSLRDALDVLHACAEQSVDAPGTPPDAFDSARENVDRLAAALAGRVKDPASAAVVSRILAAVAALEEALAGEVLPAARRGDPGARAALERSHWRLLAASVHVHELLKRMHATTSGFRRELVALEVAALGWTLILAALAPALVVGAVIYLSRSVARPLSQIAERAALIAGGDLDARIEIDTPDEFGALAAQLNAMTVSLKQHQERLVESEKLAGIGRLAAGVAHELNNPLQVILGYLSLDRDVPDRRLAEHLAAVEEEALRCKDIVESLLELSRRGVEPAAVDLRALCEDVAATLRVAMRPREVSLRVEGSASARGDRAKLRRVLFNLLKNAAEAAGPGGHVDVTIGSRGEMAEVAVRDSGPGLPADVRARLFEPFFTTKATGTGLGLAVSRAIALAHGGDIEAWNAEPGAVFALRVPRAAAADRPENGEITWNARACSS